MVYLDSSAVVKLVADERESAALTGHLEEVGAWTSSALARVEVVRAARRRDTGTVDRARRLVDGVDLIGVDEAILDVAADIGGEGLRSLDAIHLAAALVFGEELAELITYDRRMADAAERLGLPVAAPS